MGMRVKCQHCWKNFEIPADTAKKQILCRFCKRKTEIIPVTKDAQGNTVRIDKAALQTTQPSKSNTGSLIWLKLAVWLALVVSIVNTISIVGKTRGITETETEKSAEETTYKENLVSKLKALEKNLGKVSDDVTKLQPTFITSEEYSKSLTRNLNVAMLRLQDRVSGSKDQLTKTNKEVSQTRQTIKSLQKRVNKLYKRVRTLEKRRRRKSTKSNN